MLISNNTGAPANCLQLVEMRGNMSDVQKNVMARKAPRAKHCHEKADRLYFLKTLMRADLALCTPGIVKPLAIITGQLS